VILHCNYEELRAIASAAEMLAAEAEAGERPFAAGPPDAQLQLERLIPRLSGDLSIETLEDQRRVQNAVALITRTLLARLDARVIETTPANEEAVILYFDYAHAQRRPGAPGADGRRDGRHPGADQRRRVHGEAGLLRHLPRLRGDAFAPVPFVHDARAPHRHPARGSRRFGPCRRHTCAVSDRPVPARGTASLPGDGTLPGGTSRPSARITRTLLQVRQHLARKAAEEGRMIRSDSAGSAGYEVGQEAPSAAQRRVPTGTARRIRNPHDTGARTTGNVPRGVIRKKESASM
jgi:hypothetical protein